MIFGLYMRRGLCGPGAILCLATSGAACGGATNDGAHQGSCPVHVPAVGSECAKPGQTCGYGDSPRPECRELVVCGNARSGKSVWEDRSGSCVGPPPAYCPAEQPLDGSSCELPMIADAPIACTFDSAACYCTPCLGLRCLDPAPTWVCVEGGLETGCPTVAPNLGTVCTVEGLDCTFGNPCRGIGTVLACRGRAWTEGDVTCPE